MGILLVGRTKFCALLNTRGRGHYMAKKSVFHVLPKNKCQSRFSVCYINTIVSLGFLCVTCNTRKIYL